MQGIFLLSSFQLFYSIEMYAARKNWEYSISLLYVLEITIFSPAYTGQHCRTDFFILIYIAVN